MHFSVDKLSFALYTNNIIKREKTMFDKDGNYYPNDDELNEFEESEELEEELKKLGAKPLRHPTDADTSALSKGEF